jgi:transcriptional regulator with XRE-family HTH domain
MSNFFWASNIRYLRKRKRLSQEDLARELGMSRSKLNAHENGQTRNPPLDDLLSVSIFFKISIDSLLKVDLSRLSELQLRELEAGNDVYLAGTKLRVLATTVDRNNKENAELVPVKAKAGYTAGYSDPEFIAQLPLFTLPHLPQDRKYRMFPTTGDSMLPVPENAYVIGEYLEDWRSLTRETACIVIIRTEGIVFKMVTFLPEQRAFLLRSLNNNYAPYEVSAENVLEIWRFRNYLTDQIPEPLAPVQEIAQSVAEIRKDVKRLLLISESHK